MSAGNPDRGLLAEILSVFLQYDRTWVLSATFVTKEVRKRGFWTYRRPPATPERSINRYLSQNRDLFEHCGPNIYRLR